MGRFDTMTRRQTGALTRPTPADRSHLRLIVPEPLPEAVVNAAKVDPTVLEPEPQVPPYAVPVGTRATLTAMTLECEPHEATLVPGRLDFFPYMDGMDRGRFRVVSDVTGDFITCNVPLHANTVEANRAFWAFIEAVEASHPSRRR